MEHKADINARDNDWWTPLHAAAACGLWRLMNFLIAAGADPCLVNADGELPLDLAEGIKTKEVLKKEYARLEMTGDRMEELKSTEHDRHLALVNELIEKGESLDSPDRKGVTPLHCAASNGWDDVVALLITNKASLEAKDAEGNTAVMLATWSVTAAAAASFARSHHKQSPPRNGYAAIVASQPDFYSARWGDG